MARPFFLADSPRNLSWLQPVSGKTITFRAAGQPFEVTFIPFYKVYGQRYGLYWPVVPEGSDRHKDLVRRNEAIAETMAAFKPAAGEIDRVQPGDEASERAHNLRHEGSIAGTHLGQSWRHADNWWSWDLKVLPDAPVTLSCIYWGADVGRAFDILIDGRPVATQTLDGSRGARFVEIAYAIPAEWTKGRDRVTVTFRRKQGVAGGVFGCATLRPSP